MADLDGGKQIMLARTRLDILAVAVAAALAAGGCGGGQTAAGGPTPPGDGKDGDGTGGTGGADTAGGADPGGGTVAPTGLGKAADATVLADNGDHIQLSSAWLNTNAVLVFSRGHWCPFCVRQLTEFGKNNHKVEELGGKLVAITSDPEDPPKLRQKTGATFTIVSDPDLAAIKAFDVLDAGNGIARPAIVIVDKQGRITFRYVGENAADTVAIAVVLAELEKLQAAERKAGG
jgi:peroxiredoxin